MALTRSTIPKLAEGLALTSLPLGPMEGYVLSRIDGRTDLATLGSMIGLGESELFAIIEKLRGLGAVQLPGDGPRRTASGIGPAVSVPQTPARAAPAASARASKWDPAELESPSDLDVELRRRVLDTFHQLAELDHYELLGVPRAADRKAIKSAYYALAATFHTDRYFGKQLGAFKPKMEQIFGAITQAHDALTHKSRREEYDALLVERDRTRAFEQLFDLVERGSPLAPEASPKPPSVRPAAAAAAPAPAPTAPEAPTAPNRAPSTVDDAQARREALARRLGAASQNRPRAGAAIPPPPPAPTPPLSQSAEEAKAAAEFLKRRYEETLEASKRAQIRRFLDAAESATRANDVVAAANHYRLAVQLTDDPAVQLAFEEASKKARELMADAYIKQGKYEEQNGRWPAAALNFAKAAEGRPDDAELQDRAANALRMEGRDLHRAARFAESAVAKDGQNGAFRRTLGHIYLDAGLVLRARSELEVAARLTPNDETVRELLARARKLAG